MKFFSILLFVIFSCKSIDKGVVDSHVYEPATTNVILVPTRIGNSTILLPMFFVDGEDYLLIVKDDKGKCHKIYTTSENYYCIKDGDVWIKSADCSPKDQNNHENKKR